MSTVPALFKQSILIGTTQLLYQRKLK